MLVRNCKMRNKKSELTPFFQPFTYLAPQFFFSYTVTILLIWHVI